MRTLGIVLIVVGILMMIFRGFSFVREKEVVDIGPIEINKKEKETIGWPMYAGAVASIAGVIILITARKKV
jgi:drug/metabolite transporter (DMT)-like permease